MFKFRMEKWTELESSSLAPTSPSANLSGLQENTSLASQSCEKQLMGTKGVGFCCISLEQILRIMVQV